MQSLVAHAYQRAGQPPAERPADSTIVSELVDLARDDPEAVHAAWDHCVQRYAETEDDAWLRAASYLLPVELNSPQQALRERWQALHGRLGRERPGDGETLRV